MSRFITQIISSQHAEIAPGMAVRRPFPTLNLRHADPFVFLDHFGPSVHAPHTPKGDGTGAHPHRGIITVTYLFDGATEHFDSYGGHGVVRSGGVQWMVAGSGIVHDEGMSAEFAERGGLSHGIQLWLTLPKAHKDTRPSYGLLQDDELPRVELSDGAGFLKVVAGTYLHNGVEISSTMPLYSPLAIYHLRLLPHAEADIWLNPEFHAMMYLPLGRLLVGESETELKEAELGILSNSASGQDVAVFCENPTDEALDILVMAGKPLGEPIVMNGPFVMNSKEGIVSAYQDFQAGKYGTISR
ncbi:MAG: pirin family protein [Candidatus Kapabacteria bacterium]|nr:pirin family protein [Candidatus Kapabacteria bacterium]